MDGWKERISRNELDFSMHYSQEKFQISSKIEVRKFLILIVLLIREVVKKCSSNTESFLYKRIFKLLHKLKSINVIGI